MMSIHFKKKSEIVYASFGKGGVQQTTFE
jgi:hypothetical protein